MKKINIYTVNTPFRNTLQVKKSSFNIHLTNTLLEYLLFLSINNSFFCNKIAFFKKYLPFLECKQNQ